MMPAGRAASPDGGGIEMQYGAEATRLWQITPLLLTIAVVGGALLYAFS